MAQPIKTLLASIIPENHRWKLAIFEAWPRIIGKLYHKVTIEKIEDDTIFLGVCHPAWAQELSLLTPVLKQKINACLAQATIKHIRFRYTAYTPLAKPTIVPAQAPSQQSIYTMLPLLTDQDYAALATVKTDGLKSIMTAYLIRCKALRRNNDVKIQGQGNT